MSCCEGEGLALTSGGREGGNETNRMRTKYSNTGECVEIPDLQGDSLDLLTRWKGRQR